ncbi:hypothetical protein APC57_06270 [Acinetobacter baumannii]|uniref:hypothetical protein n=1 Tax=Acinetobacter baumannii TaxID=470 RepID=UPI0007073A2F|nr:hypothetical protein [Acinetobacter baumannii]KQG95747.1 hypothetical protein APC57_06270 [Acinetobacter baumannii]
MNKIMVGFSGGYDMYVSGTSSEIQKFFDAIKNLALATPNDMDWSLVLDRLYKRYVRIEDIDRTKQIMEYCKANLTRENEEENGNPFVMYFRHFFSSVSSAISFYEAFGEYRPIKLTVVDLPWQMLEAQRPLEEYDQLEGQPFWSREYTEKDIERLSNL